VTRLGLLLVLVACERERESPPSPPPPTPVPPPAPVTRDCGLATPAMPDPARALLRIAEAIDPGKDVPDAAVAALIVWDRSDATFPVGCDVAWQATDRLATITRAALVKAGAGDAAAEHAVLRLAAELRAPANAGSAISLGLGIADERRYLQLPPSPAARLFAPADDAPFLAAKNAMRCKLVEKTKLDAAALDGELLIVFDGHGNRITQFAPDDKQRLLDERRRSMGMTITPGWYADEVPTLRRYLGDTCARVLATRNADEIRKLAADLDSAVRHPTSMLVRLVGSGVVDAKGDLSLDWWTKDVSEYRAWLAKP
jgi:hypothetical protein